MKKSLSLITAALLVAMTASAQKYVLQVDSDKKVLNVAELGLSPNATALEALKCLPEMLSRQGGTYIVTNYSVQIDGVPVGDLNDAILTQLRIRDIAKIELSESSASSFANKGESGSINIILTDPDRSLSGNVTLDLAHPTDIIPGMLLTHKKDRWKLTGLFKGDYYDPSSTTVDITNDYGAPASSYESDLRYMGQTAHIHAQRTTEKDKLVLSLSENTSDTYTLEDGFEATSKSYRINLHEKYERSCESGSKLCIESMYSYSPTHEITGKVSYKLPVYRKESNKIDMEFGTNSSYSKLPESDEQTLFAMPYIKFSGNLGKWSFSAETDAQYFKYEPFGDHFDLTGLASASWQFADHQMVRLLADRKIMRQNGLTLNPIKVNSLSLDYIIDGKLENGSWMVNAGGGYIHVNDIFATSKKPYDTNYIFTADILGRIQKGVFSFSLAANLFQSQLRKESADAGHGYYYNILAIPSLNFRNGLHISSGFTYNSKVVRSFQEHSDIFFTRMVVGKTWGKIDVHVYGVINFLGKTTDVACSVWGNSYTSYTLIRNCIGAGIAYNF